MLYVLMTKGRDKVAESLSDILQMISSRRRTGLLSVERYNASRFEEGEIYFEKGHPAQAFFEMLSGQEALAKLLTWRNVYYSFTVDVPVPVVPMPPQAIPGGISPYATTDPSTRLPHTTAPLRQTNEPPATSPLRHSSQYQPPTGPQPLVRQTQPPYFPQQEGRTSHERTTGYNQTSEGANALGFDGLVPHRLGDEQNVLTLPLTRPQRSIYLLIDGSRTVADLARCIGKNVQDVELVLMELKQQGLIGF